MKKKPAARKASRGKKKDRITLNKFDLEELATLASEQPSSITQAAEHFIFLQKRGNPEDMRIISNLFKEHGPVCDIRGNHYDLISTAQLLLLYISDAEDLRRQLLEQLAKRQGVDEQGERFI